jgi:predicted dienelactone hydrolase
MKQLLWIFATFLTSGAVYGAGLADKGTHAVETIEFPQLIDAARERKIPIKVHIPSDGGPYPVVALSHGGGGSWDANYAQAQHLASHGYVVLAIEHVGSNTDVMKRRLRFRKNLETMSRDANEVLGRPKDVSFALDQAEQWSRSHARLRGKMDLEHIGMLGHSFGAYTTFVIAGARPALDWLQPPVAPGRGLGPDLSDSRINCGVALSPHAPGEPFFIESSFSTLRVPLLGISGDKDRQQGDALPEDRKHAFKLWPPGDKYLVWIENADHTAFSDSTGAGLGMLPSRSRESVQPIVRAATLVFFDIYLKGRSDAKQFLSANELVKYSTLSVEVLNK